jgi:glutathione peroxidase
MSRAARTAALLASLLGHLDLRAQDLPSLASTLRDQVVAQGLLVWSATELVSWPDFRGPERVVTDEAAQIMSGMGCGRRPSANGTAAASSPSTRSEPTPRRSAGSRVTTGQGHGLAPTCLDRQLRQDVQPEGRRVDLYQIPVTSIDGTPGTLAPYQNEVLLVVNVASRCRFTSQYTALEMLYRRYHPAGFSVLGFPCNQFAGQEPGSEADILSFCLREYEISFPLFSKVEVNGPETHPVYRYLKESDPALGEMGAIEWNFTKFLVARGGKVVNRYAPKFSPGHIEPDIIRALEAPRPASSGPAH